MREWVLHYKEAIRISLLALFRWTLLAVCTGVLCGGSAGREGAALQMGGSIGWNIGRVLHFNNHDCRTATVCGMAAFFSALFGTPLTATLFAMMVVDVGLMLTVAFVPGFSAAVGLVCVFCGATNTLVASILLAAELFSGAGFELMALACGLSYMFSGYHSLYSSQGFRTSKLFSEFLQPKEGK